MRTSTADRGRVNSIPTRAALAIAGTVLGVVLLFSFKTPDQLPARIAAGHATSEAQSPGPTSGSAAAPATPGTAKTVIGDDVPNQFGDVQVEVHFAGGKIIDVKAVQLPFDRARSAQISKAVEPYLRSEALQAQSAQIDLISGATYTSESYAESLQSAIDKAHG